MNQNEKAPLHKSHKDYGFNEPLKQYSPAIGISEIVHIPEKFDKSFSHDYFVAAMGDNKSDGDLSFHHIKISYDHKKIIYDKIIFLNERVRDINYVKDLNIVLLFLESSGSIGVIRYKI